MAHIVANSLLLHAYFWHPSVNVIHYKNIISKNVFTLENTMDFLKLRKG